MALEVAVEIVCYKQLWKHWTCKVSHALCRLVVLLYCFFSISFAHYFPIASSCIMSCFVKSRAIFSSDHSCKALLAFMWKWVSTTSQCAMVCWAHSCHCIPSHAWCDGHDGELHLLKLRLAMHHHSQRNDRAEIVLKDRYWTFHCASSKVPPSVVTNWEYVPCFRNINLHVLERPFVSWTQLCQGVRRVEGIGHCTWKIHLIV